MWRRRMLRSAQQLSWRCGPASLRGYAAESSAAAALEEDPRGPFSEKVQRLGDEIAGLTPEELSAMSEALRRKLGLPEPPPAGAAVDWQQLQDDSSLPSSDSTAPAAAQEKTSFSVKIEKFDSASKIKVIKEVRAVTDLGLKEAKEFVEKVPAVVKSGLSKEEAAQLVEKLKAAGATAVVE